MKNKQIILTVKTPRLGPVVARHPWVFSGALNQIPEGLTSGDQVVLHDERGRFLAQGYFNSYSQIAVRLWSYDENELIDQKFFDRRIKSAFNLRLSLIDTNKTNSFRVINSENDLLPGLIVDKYDKYLCVQFHTRGIEVYKEQIIKSLNEIIKPEGIYEKSESLSRQVEDLEKRVGIITGDIPDKILIKENDFKFQVDIPNGQKTGFFLDQRDKRQALAKYVQGKKVLNCFSYTGGFSVYALAAGAKLVTSVDSSESAMELAKENIAINKLDAKKSQFIETDVKKYLTKIEPGQFDVIILDPPAFIKDRRKIKQGLKGYMGINKAAFSMLKENDILVTCSCSSHLDLEDFRHMVAEAAAKAGKNVKILETYTNGIDHPILPSFKESDYLKCLFVAVS